MKRISIFAALTALLLLAALPAAAKKNDPEVQLRYVPQQAVAGSSAGIRSTARQTPIEVRLEDARDLDDALVIGSRTSDRDQLFDLVSVDPVGPFAQDVLERSAKEWGARLSEDAELVLVVELLTFEVTETNQAVGATYEASVKLFSQLENRSGKVLWTGSHEGDATRWGRKYSNANCNEVLSDALREAYAALLGDSALQSKWSGK